MLLLAASEQAGNDERAGTQKVVATRTFRTPIRKLSGIGHVRSHGQVLGESPSSRTGLLPSSPLRTVHESFLSHSSSPSNASFRETRFRDRNALAMNPVMALWMK